MTPPSIFGDFDNDERPDLFVTGAAGRRLYRNVGEGRFEDAVAELRKTRFEASSTNIPYERGVALLAAGQPEEALTDLRKVLDWVGIDIDHQNKALARLQIARAYVAMGDMDAARNAYLDFLEYWAQADENLPLLQKARSEYEALPGAQG